MAIGARLAAEVGALSQAVVNSGQGVSMLQVAEGAMARANDILNRMKMLAVQAGSGQLSADERNMLDAEYQQLLSEIDRIAAHSGAWFQLGGNPGRFNRVARVFTGCAHYRISSMRS